MTDCGFTNYMQCNATTTQINAIQNHKPLNKQEILFVYLTTSFVNIRPTRKVCAKQCTLACSLRFALPPPPIVWFMTVTMAKSTIKISYRSLLYCQAIKHILDLLWLWKIHTQSVRYTYNIPPGVIDQTSQRSDHKTVCLSVIMSLVQVYLSFQCQRFGNSLTNHQRRFSRHEIFIWKLITAIV